MGDYTLDVEFECAGPIEAFANRMYVAPVKHNVRGVWIFTAMIIYAQPITDGRVARRIARRSGYRFKWTGNRYEFDISNSNRRATQTGAISRER